MQMTNDQTQAEKWNAEADRYLAQRDELIVALRKIRGHTSYQAPTLELLAGLLQSIERIADAALAAHDPER